MSIKYFTRRSINRICDNIQPSPSLDPFAAKVATKVRKEQIKDQLVNIKMIQTDEAVEKMQSYINKRDGCAFIKDSVAVGLRDAEAMTSTIAQLSQSAFKAVDQGGSLGGVVNTMISVLTTVQDRADQNVTVHFDASYAPEENFDLREIVDMRAHFVGTYVSDLIKPNGMEIGVMAEFEGDGVSPDIREKRVRALTDYHAPVIQPGRWNKINARLNEKSPSSNSVFTLRLHLNNQLMYSHGITIQNIILMIINHSDEIANQISIVPSTYAEGIIDIMPGQARMGPNWEKDLAESLFLEVVKKSLTEILISGLYSVNSMQIMREDIQEQIQSYKPANSYYVGELGREKWLADNNLKYTWDQVEYNTWLTDNSRENDIKLGEINGFTCILSFEDEKLPKPTENELTELFIKYYCGTLENLWMLTLDVVKMRIKCIDTRLVIKLLEYCGIEIVKIVKHSILEVDAYIYVRSIPNSPT